MKAASLPWQWLRFSLLYPWGHSTCPFSITGCAGKKANSVGHRQPPASYLLSALLAGGRGVPSSALDKPLMTPRAEGKVGAATFPKQCLLLFGRCQNSDSVLHIYHRVSSARPRPVWIARQHMTRGIGVKGMTEVLDKMLK